MSIKGEQDWFENNGDFFKDDDFFGRRTTTDAVVSGSTAQAPPQSEGRRSLAQKIKHERDTNPDFRRLITFGKIAGTGAVVVEMVPRAVNLLQEGVRAVNAGGGELIRHGIPRYVGEGVTQGAQFVQGSDPTLLQLGHGLVPIGVAYVGVRLGIKAVKTYYKGKHTIAEWKEGKIE